MTADAIITLTTDFGLLDTYVASMKGVILGIAPNCEIVDVTHQVPPQDVASGSRAVLSVYRYFPSYAVHVVVVDPGVGTGRRPVAVAGTWGTYVGPDNGIFAPVLVDQGSLAEGGKLINAHGYELVSPAYRNPSVSTTFHGRDIFAPAAAHITLGVPLSRFGPPVDSLVEFLLPTPHVEGAVIRGRVVHIDTFGNVVTNLTRDLIPRKPGFDVGEITILGLSATYQERDVVALVGSTGLIEVARRNGNAAKTFDLEVGDEIIVRSVE